MFVGHSFLAFAVVGAVGRVLGWRSDRALRVAAIAAIAALAPDVDVVFALDGFLSLTPVGAFWAQTGGTHRLVTHSLVLAPPGAAIAGLAAGRRSGLLAGLCALAITAVGLATAGPGEARLLAVLFVALLAAGLAARRLAVRPGEAALATLVGLVTHPFGDLFTGSPPAMLWPLGDRLGGPLFAARIAPFSDPTLDFLLAFGVELAAIWAGSLVALSLAGVPSFDSPFSVVQPRVVVAVAYAGTLFVLPRPTVDFAWPFVASVLPVALVGVPRPSRRPDPAWWSRAWLSGLATVTLAACSWALGYVLL